MHGETHPGARAEGVGRAAEALVVFLVRSWWGTRVQIGLFGSFGAARWFSHAAPPKLDANSHHRGKRDSFRHFVIRG
jgi:hypothetical protein